MMPFLTSLKIRIVHEIVHIAKKTIMLDVLFYLLYRQCLMLFDCHIEDYIGSSPALTW